jgi:hypothetical protein
MILLYSLYFQSLHKHFIIVIREFNEDAGSRRCIPVQFSMVDL